MDLIAILKLLSFAKVRLLTISSSVVTLTAYTGEPPSVHSDDVLLAPKTARGHESFSGYAYPSGYRDRKVAFSQSLVTSLQAASSAEGPW